MLATIVISIFLLALSRPIYFWAMESKSCAVVVTTAISIGISGIVAIAVAALLHYRGDITLAQTLILGFVGCAFLYQVLQLIPAYHDLKAPPPHF